MTENPNSNSEISKRIAAIDLGTNSFHAIIVDIHTDGSLDTIDTYKEMVCLGEDVAEHRLSEKAMQRGLEAMKKIKLLCERQGVDKILAYATSAIRESVNGGDFIQMVIDHTQIKIYAIPGEMEAELIGHAVQHAIALDAEPVLMMDIGGGSVEFIIGNNEKFFSLFSRKMGVSRTASTFIKHDPITNSEIKAIRDFFDGQLKKVAKAIRRRPLDTLVGSSGTMENIASIIAVMKKADTSVTLNEFVYSPSDFRKVYKQLIGMSHKERLQVTGLDPKRVDFIIPGLILLDLIINKFKIKQIKTSTQALREGIILHHIKHEMKGMNLMTEFADPRRRSVYELLQKCNWDAKHSAHVTGLALKLFDQTRTEHNLSDNDRELLEYASLMHDIGYYISHRKHHRHALYLVLNADLKGFTQDEIQVMGHVARYHRRSTPKKRHSEFYALESDVKDRIIKLSGFMRVADGLDRSHYQNVKDLKTIINGKKIAIYIKTHSDPELEIWGAMRKCELFEKLFSRKLEIKPVRTLSKIPEKLETVS